MRTIIRYYTVRRDPTLPESATRKIVEKSRQEANALVRRRWLLGEHPVGK